jgi:arylsulfatase A-like enzyme
MLLPSLVLPVGLGLAALIAPAFSTQVGIMRAPPEHVVLFMIDDLGWRDLEPAAWAPVPGDDANLRPSARHFKTPNIARLAAEGVRFSEAYAAAPVCTPTRTSLMLGQSPARTGITYWTKDVDRDQSAPFPRGAPVLRAPKWRVNGIQPGEATLASRMSSAGLRTIHVGKAHFGTGAGGDPSALGFDVNIAGWAGGGPGSYLAEQNFSAAWRKGGHGWDVPGLEAYHGKKMFLTDVLANEAERAMRKAIFEDARIFLNFAPYAVHAPLTVNERVRGRFPDLEGPELAYATLVASVDDAVGQLLGVLDDLHIADKTLVVFTSDNGGLSAHGRGGEKHTHNAPLRSGKGSAYEGGIRIPMIVRWPGVTEAGRMVDGAVVTQDLFPTLLSAAGADRTASGATGIDLAPVLAGADVPQERPLIWHQPHYWGVPGPGIEPFSAVRVGRWKLVYLHSSLVEREGKPVRLAVPRFELFDLLADVGETTDLASAEPATVAALAEVLSAQLEAAGAALSIDVETDRPIPLPREALARSR